MNTAYGGFIGGLDPDADDADDEECYSHKIYAIQCPRTGPNPEDEHVCLFVCLCMCVCLSEHAFLGLAAFSIQFD